MKLVSTSGKAPPVDLRTALLQGLAPDGGLYMPSPLARLPEATVRDLRGAPLEATALTVAHHLLGDELGAEQLAGIVRDALDFPIPLRALGERVFLLELFHGPTLAFKDVGARFMARLMASYVESPLTVLAATSGDTGSAVAHAFLGLPNIRVVILYPEGQVSRIQEHQFATLGGNVTALAVWGTFDDCQRLAKQALADQGLRREIVLTSANSINIGRLLPQILYYFHTWAQLPEGQGEVVIAVPSGNFGNLTAGLMAKQMGLPVMAFVAATNVNDVVPEYLRTGRFRSRASLRTISNAMDVGNPSNFARMLTLYDGDESRMRRDVVGSSHTDDETRECITRVFERFGYALDPHSAVGYLGLDVELRRRPEAVGICLGTAHPAKFADIVEPLIGHPIPVPERLTACLDREPQVTPLEPRLEDVKKVLLTD